MSNVFISYSRNDIDFAEKIVEALRKNNLDTWIDWKSIPKGSKWRQEIYHGIEEADVFLFLISPDSVQSNMCKEEIAHAKDNENKIVTLLIRKTDITIIPQELSDIQWIECIQGIDDVDKVIAMVSKTIHRDLDWLQFRRRLQIKAREWKQSNYKNGYLLHGEDLEEREKIFFSSKDKNPQPTNLQKQYITVSRIEEDKQVTERKKTRGWLWNLGIVLGITAIIALIAIGVATLFGGQLGISAIRVGLANATAQAGATIAEQQANANATAQINVQVQQNRANQQTQIARANQLATQATSLRNTDPISSLLLSAEAFKLVHNLQTRNSLWGSTQAYPHLHQFVSTMGTSLEPTNDNFAGGLAFSPDGKIIATGGFEGTIILSDVSTGQRIRFMAPGSNDLDKVTDSNNVSLLVFSPNSKLIAAGVDNGVIILWDVSTGQELRTIRDGNLAVMNLAFSPDGHTLASYIQLINSDGSMDSDGGRIILWDVDTGGQLQIKYPFDTILNEWYGLTNLYYSTNGKQLIGVSDIGTVYTWDSTARSRSLITETRTECQLGA